jgi:hypothetical protein
MTREAFLSVWSVPEGTDLSAMIEIAHGRLLPPDFRAHLLSSTGDTITVQVVDGAPPLDDELLYIEQRGAFEVLRREVWPEGRVLLTLSAWPNG